MRWGEEYNDQNYPAILKEGKKEKRNVEQNRMTHIILNIPVIIEIKMDQPYKLLD